MRSAIYQSHGLTLAKAVLAQARFVISDIDGVLFDPTGCPVVGAAKLFASRPCALVSNNSTLTAKTIAKRFADGGAYISQERIFLAGEYAVSIALKRFGSAPMLWLASDEIGELAEKMLNEARSVGETAGILICRDRTLTMEHLERIVNAVRCGAEVILANPDFTHPEGENVRMETGAIWSAVSCQLETACSPVLVGKPETLLAEEALRMLGANRREVVFLGDNPDTDGLTAQRLGVNFIHTGGRNGFPLAALM